MCDCGAPCRRRTGGPCPAITPLIVAPFASIMSGLNPGKKRLALAAAGWDASAASTPAPGNAAAVTTAVICRNMSRRVTDSPWVVRTFATARDYTELGATTGDRVSSAGRRWVEVTFFAVKGRSDELRP